jgi:mono/diheme cytochrome c family protein
MPVCHGHGCPRVSAVRIAALALAAVLAAILLTGVGLYVSSRRPAIEPVSLESVPAFDPGTVRRGAELAALGDCRLCHTAAGGAPYAGGRPIPTPFGAVYASNITPDAATGIGAWSKAAFRRAMREGIDREGRQLYPAFPYPHYALVSDADIDALYAFLVTRPAVRTRVPASPLPFPIRYRWIVAGWKLLFFHPERTATGMKRGAYLVEGLGHCGDCHTPRNLLGAERNEAALAGGASEGWDAPALDADSPAPVPWSAEELFVYLRHGAEPVHGAAAGPMLEVTGELESAAEVDVRAMALYLSARIGKRASRARGARAPSARDPLAAILYSSACAGCHRAGSRLAAPDGIDLSRSTLLGMARPIDTVRVILEGIEPAPGEAGPWMPSFAGSFTAGQLVELLAELRARFSTRSAWAGEARAIRKVQHQERQ